MKYVLADYFAVNIGWLAFNCIRYTNSIDLMLSEGFTSIQSFLLSSNVLFGQVLIPLGVLFIFYLSGYYVSVFRKSRLQELITTLFSTFVSTIGIFFAVLINDSIEERMANYEMIVCLWITLFVPVYILRLFITTDATKKIQGRVWQFNTLVIGNGVEAHKLVSQIESMKQSLGYGIIGYVNIEGEKAGNSDTDLVFGFEEIPEVCEKYSIQELLVVPTIDNVDSVLNVVNKLFPLSLPIRLSPSLIHILISKVRLSNIAGVPLVDVAGGGLSDCETIIKRVFDVMVSLITLLLLSPFFLIISILIKLDSRGPVFYTQERIGYRNIPFKIIKFRTMIENAEKDGIPMLTTDADSRITRLGRYMRKYRIDEFPQFFNILKGEMSLVGPRPERRYFIEQIMKTAPYYALLHQIRPGLTSMGMVKYGYASSVEEMLERLKFDIIYIENMSLINDLKILIYTVKTVITGKGL